MRTALSGRQLRANSNRFCYRSFQQIYPIQIVYTAFEIQATNDMVGNTKTLKAACLCGDANHEITLASEDFPLPCYFCTCDSCRHMTGCLFLSTTYLPSSYEPSQDLLEKLTLFKFTDRVTTYSCKRCGCLMFDHCLPDPQTPGRQANWDIMTGTLETFDGDLDLKGYEYVHDTIDGGFTDFMPVANGRTLDRWPYGIEGEAKLPLYWRDPETPKPPEAGTRLGAHCKCKGVRFYVARPSTQSTQASRSWPDLLIPHYEQSDEKGDAAHETWWLRANKTKFLAGLCSCNSCRLASGMEITPWAFIPKIDISLDAEGKVPFEDTFGTLKTYNSSEGVVRSFCSICGAIVFFANVERDKTTLLDVAVGLFNAPEGSRAESWLEWRTERLSFREDAVGRANSLVAGIEKGLGEFRAKGHGRHGPAEEVSQALGA